MDTNTENIRSHLIRTCNIPDDTIPDVINHDAIAHIRKCVRQIIVNKPHECGLSWHPAPYIQPTRVPFGYGDLVGNSFEYRSTRTARIYLIAPSLEYIKNDHDAHTTYTSIQLRVYYRTVPDMQHPTPTYGSIALPEYLLSHDTTTRADNPTVITEPPHIDYTRNMWPISDRAHDIELLRQYHRIAHIICQRFQTNPDEGGRRTAKRILSDGYSGLCHNSNTHHNIYKRISLIAHPDKNVTRDTFHCALAHLVMESIQKAFDITTSLTTNADSRQAFQLIPTLDSERFHNLVHSYRRPTLTRSVSDPSIRTTNKSDNTLTETPARHNNISSPLRRFTTMPPPSTTGRTPLTPGLNTYAIDSLRHSFNPISATNLFPDETPDTDRASSTTEPAHFSDIDEDDPSPYDDEPPSIDDDVPVIRVATDTGGVDTGHTAPAPHTDMTIGDTNNPTGTHGTMPTGPSDDTHVANSNTAASPISRTLHTAGVHHRPYGTDLSAPMIIHSSSTLTSPRHPLLRTMPHPPSALDHMMTPTSSTLAPPRRLLSSANGNMLRQKPHGDNAKGGKVDETLMTQPECLTAVVHRRAGTERAERECGVLRTAALSILRPSPPASTSGLRCFGRGEGEGGGGAVLCGGSPASGVAQAGNEEEGAECELLPSPFYALHRLCPLALRSRAGRLLSLWLFVLRKNTALSRGWCTPLTRGSAVCGAKRIAQHANPGLLS